MTFQEALALLAAFDAQCDATDTLEFMDDWPDEKVMAAQAVVLEATGVPEWWLVGHKLQPTDTVESLQVAYAEYQATSPWADMAFDAYRESGKF